MKFKENVDLSKVIFQDKIEKLFDEKTVNKMLELEETIQDFWNVDRSSANFLNMIIKLKGVKNALEIGTSNGYSSIWLAKALKETKGHLTTIEYWQKRVDLALENFKKTDTENIISTITGDAIEILAKMAEDKKEEFDFIFIDANKAEYIEYFKSCDKILKKGGVILSDNILSHYKKTENFVQEIVENKNYQSQLLNFEAGMLFSIKVN